MWGSRGCGEVRGGGAPLSVPLDTGFRRYDDGGCSGRRVLLVAEAEVPASAGTTMRVGLLVSGFLPAQERRVRVRGGLLVSGFLPAQEQQAGQPSWTKGLTLRLPQTGMTTQTRRRGGCWASPSSRRASVGDEEGRCECAAVLGLTDEVILSVV